MCIHQYITITHDQSSTITSTTKFIQERKVKRELRTNILVSL